MRPSLIILWGNMGPCPPKEYTCGHCGSPIASEKGTSGEVRMRDAHNQTSRGNVYIYICHFCTRPTFFDTDGKQVPGVCYGNPVSDIDDTSVRDLYEEARRATCANCNTAAVLCCRKLLMHLAVAKGAEPNKTFKYYVEYLGENYVPKPTIDWVNHIKDKGNEANHVIMIVEPDEAKEMLAFVEMLLKLIYEFPATMLKKHPPSIAQS